MDNVSNDLPLVSVIMGVYNSGKTLASAVDSILAQTYANFEFLICDDASTDDSLRILAQYKDQRIKLLKNSVNHGLAYSLNKCLKMCTGYYVARMDADDVSFPNRLAEQVAFLESNTSIDAVGSSVVIWDGEKDIGVRKFPELPNKKHLLNSNPFAHPTMMLKRSVYQKLGGYTVSNSTKRAEDLDLWFRFFNHGFKGYNMQMPLLRYAEAEEDYEKRTICAALGIAKVYLKGYKLLNFPKLCRVYCLKPVISSMLPTKLKLYLRKKRLKH